MKIEEKYEKENKKAGVTCGDFPPGGQGAAWHALSAFDKIEMFAGFPGGHQTGSDDWQDTLRMRKSKYTKDLLGPVVAKSLSFAQVLRELGLKPTGGNYRNIAARMRLLGIATSHFRGMGWARGETAQTHPVVARTTRRLRRPDEEVFVENSPEIIGYRLVRRILRRGVPYACTECGISEWRGKRLRLHLDHRNGVNNDNRLENLRLLCPNCHSQTRTYCKRKVRSLTASW